MKIFARATTVVALLLAALSAANAQVQFAAKATISIPANGAQFHAGTLYAGQFDIFHRSLSVATISLELLLSPLFTQE